MSEGWPRTAIVGAMLLGVTAVAVSVHGYHLGADDGAIYVPAIKSVADPGLYPFGAEFFSSHAHWSIFARLVGGSARWMRLPIDTVIFGWHLASIFALLWASWRLAGVCFERDRARWGGVALLAALLSVPVAGTALAVMDPYLTARSLSTPATLLAITFWLDRRKGMALGCLGFTLLIHPQMSAFLAAFLVCLEWAQRRPEGSEAHAAWAPFLFPLAEPKGAAREALFARTYFFVYQWAWYEWVGVLAPLGLLWWLGRRRPRGTTEEFRTLAGALVPFGLLFTAAGMVVGFPVWLENYTRLQPMRSFHLLYVVLFVMVGGLAQEYLLKSSTRRWLALFVPLAAGMWWMQAVTFPASLHVEWPGEKESNKWDEAFLWIRGNTPKNAVFAVDPDYMTRPGEDMHGFRAVAERSVLADEVKDSGAVSLFPQLADDWRSQTQAEHGWSHFARPDFERLQAEFGVSWILTEMPGPAGMTCPYENRDVAVCRVAR